MKLPIQAQPVYRNVNNGKNSQVGIIPSDDCTSCLAEKAACLISKNPISITLCLAITELSTACQNCQPDICEGPFCPGPRPRL